MATFIQWVKLVGSIVEGTRDEREGSGLTTMLTVSAEEPSINNVGIKGDGEAMMPSMPSLSKMLNKPAIREGSQGT